MVIVESCVTCYYYSYFYNAYGVLLLFDTFAADVRVSCQQQINIASGSKIEVKGEVFVSKIRSDQETSKSLPSTGLRADLKTPTLWGFVNL